MRRFIRSTWQGYAVALLALGGALVIRMAVQPLVGNAVPFITVFGAVVFAVWYAGAGPALTVAAIGYFAAHILFVDGFSVRVDAVTLLVYALSTGLIVALGGAMHLSRRRAEDAMSEAQAQRALLETTETRFRAFMHNSPDCVFIRDDEGRYVFVNTTAERFLGTGEAGWKGKRPRDLQPAETARALEEAERVVKSTKRPLTLDLAVPGRPHARHFRSTIFPLPDASGRMFFGAVAADVTEQKRYEEALHAAQKQLQMVTDTLPVAVLWTGCDMRYRWVNPQFAAWLKKTPGELVGRHMAEVLGEEIMGVLRPYLERAQRGEPVAYERIANLPGLGARWISMVLTPIRDDAGNVDGWVTIGSDVHDRKMAEAQLRESDRRKDEFLAMLAHELRNPLAPIRNAVAILGRKAANDPELVWSREVIERQVQQMTRLIDDLLDIERISRGKLLVRKERVLLETVIDMALETSRPHINSAGHRLSVVLPTERVAVDADPTRLAQVFSNLLNNAARYTEPQGEISLLAAVEGAQVVVTVEDNGIGFPPETALSLFTPFSQLARANAQSAGGLGIGLSLVQGIVALHGGEVEAHSAGLGQGSRFVVRLPLSAAPEARPAAPVRPGEEALAVPGVKVLVADDNKDAADSLARILGLYGYDVRVCYDGTSALALCDSFQPQVAVLDIGMPGTNGYDTARAMRARYGDRVSLVAVTGWGQEADRRRAMDAGFDHHLTKPVDPGALNELLAKVTA